MKITDSIPVSIGIPYNIQLSLDRKHFYVTEPRLQTVEIIDIPSKKPIGTFTLTTPHGAILTGTAAGGTDAAVPVSSLQLTFTVLAGTKDFQHASGTIDLSGTLTGNLTRG